MNDSSFNSFILLLFFKIYKKNNKHTVKNNSPVKKGTKVDTRKQACFSEDGWTGGRTDRQRDRRMDRQIPP